MQCRFENLPILCLYMKIYVEDFTLKLLLLSKICVRETCEKFVYKHSETIEYVKNYFLRNLQTSRANNSTFIWIKNPKFSGYYF